MLWYTIGNFWKLNINILISLCSSEINGSDPSLHNNGMSHSFSYCTKKLKCWCVQVIKWVIKSTIHKEFKMLMFSIWKLFIVFKASSLLSRWTLGGGGGWRPGGVNCGGGKLVLTWRMRHQAPALQVKFSPGSNIAAGSAVGREMQMRPAAKSSLARRPFILKKKTKISKWKN